MQTIPYILFLINHDWVLHQHEACPSLTPRVSPPSAAAAPHRPADRRPPCGAWACNTWSVHIYYEDGMKFVRRKAGEYDLIVVDSTDPFGPGEALFPGGEAEEPVP